MLVVVFQRQHCPHLHLALVWPPPPPGNDVQLLSDDANLIILFVIEAEVAGMLPRRLQWQKISAVREVVTALLLYAILKVAFLGFAERRYSDEDAAFALAQYPESNGCRRQNFLLDYCDRDVVVGIIDPFEYLALALNHVISAF